jgi:hypothetical protein
MIHVYKVLLRCHVWSVCDAGDRTVTVRAYSAEDALTIVRVRLKAQGFGNDSIENIYCEEGQ